MLLSNRVRPVSDLSQAQPERLHTRLDRSLSLADRIRYRANRIDRLGSSHSNMARALAKDSLLLLALAEGSPDLAETIKRKFGVAR